MTSGIYIYSRAGFGKMADFLMVWGYWMSLAFGNVSYAVLLMEAVNYFSPLFCRRKYLAVYRRGFCHHLDTPDFRIEGCEDRFNNK